jgi:4'-phosphopantetheinyl transferase
LDRIRLDEETWLYHGVADGAHIRARVLSCHLAEVLGLTPDAVTLRTDVKGKPELADPALALWFNCSHCPGLLLIATSRLGPVGADLETVERCRSAHDDAAREFSAAEQAWLAAVPNDDRPLAFARLWTAKEAVLKARGTGIVEGLRQPELAAAFASCSPPPWSAIVAELGADHYTVSWYTLPIHEAMVVAARADDAAARTRRFANP